VGTLFTKVVHMKTINSQVRREILTLIKSESLTTREAALRFGFPEPLIQVWLGHPLSPPPTPASPASPPTQTPTPNSSTPVVPNPIDQLSNESTDNVGTRVYDNALRSTALLICSNGLGSGFLLDCENRLLATAYHVVDETEDIIVVFPEFKDDDTVIANPNYYVGGITRTNTVLGKVVLRIKEKDLALVCLDRIPPGFRPATLTSKRARPGEDVHAIGNPGASHGFWIFSGGQVRQVFDNFEIVHAAVAQTTLPSNCGDSGGPVLNNRGEIIGLASGLNPKDNKGDDVNLVSYSIDAIEVRTMWERYLRMSSDSS
jgi:S1-C subfamily serine protease